MSSDRYEVMRHILKATRQVAARDQRLTCDPRTGIDTGMFHTLVSVVLICLVNIEIALLTLRLS